jgi:23S rRNA G2445 N2-methylase RlmL
MSFINTQPAIKTNYFATHGRGIDEFVRNELIKLNNNIETTNIKNYVEGKINFESTLKPNELIFKLKTIERLFFCVFFKKFDESDKNNDIDKLLSYISFRNFDQYCVLINKNDEDYLAKKKPRLASIKYRINCKLTGNWRKNDRQIVKEKLNKKFEDEYFGSKNFEINDTEPDIELILHITNDCIACGVQLNKESLAVRPYIKHVGLRSTICAIMLQLAELDTNTYKIVCDPFCGKGTIIMEFLGSSLNSSFYFLMSDVSNEQLKFCQENMRHLGSSLGNIDLLNFCLKSNVCLPYRDNSIDVIITDLPFGKQHSFDSFLSNESSSSTKSFYMKIILEFKRIIVKNKGIISILINRYDMNVFEDCIEKANETEFNFNKFKISQKHMLNLGETNATVYKLGFDC